jgi:hypothetical protein
MFEGPQNFDNQDSIPEITQSIPEYLQPMEGENGVEEIVSSVRDEFLGAEQLAIAEIIDRAALSEDELEILKQKAASPFDNLEKAQSIEQKLRDTISQMLAESAEITA